MGLPKIVMDARGGTAVVVFGPLFSAVKVARKRARAGRRRLWVYRDMDSHYRNRGNNVWAILDSPEEHPDLLFQCTVG